jgi:hypothetical protein
MPRRVYTYPAGVGLETPNLIESIGAYVFAIGLVVTLWNVVRSRISGVVAGANPWGAATLEWLASSPPEHFNFAHIPVVTGREPLWTGGPLVGPAFDEARLSPRTTALDAELEHVIELPHDNVWTVVMSLALLGVFAAVLVRWNWTAAACAAVAVMSAARWMWPLPSRVMETEA